MDGIRTKLNLFHFTSVLVDCIVVNCRGTRGSCKCIFRFIFPKDFPQDSLKRPTELGVETGVDNGVGGAVRYRKDLDKQRQGTFAGIRETSHTVLKCHKDDEERQPTHTEHADDDRQSLRRFHLLDYARRRVAALVIVLWSMGVKKRTFQETHFVTT